MASLVLLLAAMAGPWLYDSHPATAETCPPPLVWLGGGHCACLVTLVAAFQLAVRAGPAALLIFCLVPALPLLSTAALILGRERRSVWILHLLAWGLTAAFALFLLSGMWPSGNGLKLWGADLGGLLAVVMLAGEIGMRFLAGREARPMIE